MEREILLLGDPRLEFRGEERMELLDDCMSFPNLLVRVRRYRHCTLHYREENWSPREIAMDERSLVMKKGAAK